MQKTLPARVFCLFIKKPAVWVRRAEDFFLSSYLFFQMLFFADRSTASWSVPNRENTCQKR